MIYACLLEVPAEIVGSIGGAELKKLLAVWLVAILASLAFGSSQALATDENAFKVRTVKEGADFYTILEHRPGLSTDLSVSVVHSAVEENASGVDNYSEVSMFGTLTVCTVECRDIWDVVSYGDPRSLTFGSNNAEVEADLSVQVYVHDFMDTDHDDDLYETVAEFKVPIKLSLSWEGTEALNPAGGCFWSWSGGELTMNRFTGGSSDAAATGSLNGLIVEGYGSLFHGENEDIYKTKPQVPIDPCQI